jgi:hypothetical protein
MQCGGGFSHTKGWLDICGYKLHLISSTIGSSVIVPLTADFLQLQIYRTTRDVHSRLIASLLVTIITKEKHPIYVSADHGYDDDHELLYDLSTDMGFQLVGVSSTEI